MLTHQQYFQHSNTSLVPVRQFCLCRWTQPEINEHKMSAYVQRTSITTWQTICIGFARLLIRRSAGSASRSILGSKACERSVSRAENGAERAENRVSGNGAVSGDLRKWWSVSGERSGELRSGNGAESGLSWALKDRSEVDPTVALIKSVPVIINLNFDWLANQPIHTRVTRILTVVSARVLVDEIRRSIWL